MSTPGRFLIATWDGGGNTGSQFNLGSRLARRGHRVRMLGWESMSRQAAAAGLEFTQYPSVPPWPTGLQHEDGWQLLEQSLHSAATCADIMTEAAAFGADVLVIDCMLGAGYDAARQLRVPTAVLVHVLYAPFVHAWGDGVMHTNVAELLSAADRVLALTPPGFDSPTPLPPNTAYVGPITDLNRPSGRRDLECAGLAELLTPGDPWVLLSLSTTLQGQAAALPPMLDAVASLPVRVLLTLGSVLPISAVAAPPNVTVREFVPHALVLPYLAAVISHGGLSTITTALAGGVPIVCIPQGREQPLNAAQVVACGAGRSVANDASAAEIGVALSDLLGDAGARSAARRFADVIAALGSGEQATQLIEALAQVSARDRPSRVLSARSCSR